MELTEREKQWFTQILGLTGQEVQDVGHGRPVEVAVGLHAPVGGDDGIVDGRGELAAEDADDSGEWVRRVIRVEGCRMLQMCHNGLTYLVQNFGSSGAPVAAGAFVFLGVGQAIVMVLLRNSSTHRRLIRSGAPSATSVRSIVPSLWYTGR